jgi:hypothetical protein
LPHAVGVPASIRLRHVLKSLLRHYRFRCREIKQLPNGGANGEKKLQFARLDPSKA